MNSDHNKLWMAVAGVMALCFMSGCRTIPVVSVDYSEKTDFSRYHTFFILPIPREEQIDNPALSPNFIEKARKAMQEGLVAKGFRPASQAEADFFISARGRVSPTRHADYGDLEERVMKADHDVYWRYETEAYHDTVITVDIVDAKSGELVWRGGHGISTWRDRFDPDKVGPIITLLLQRFPPVPHSAPPAK